MRSDDTDSSDLVTSAAPADLKDIGQLQVCPKVKEEQHLGSLQSTP